jgi:hypothetical protein
MKLARDFFCISGCVLTRSLLGKCNCRLQLPRQVC